MIPCALPHSLKGIHYTHCSVYKCLTALKLWHTQKTRFHLASSFIHGGESVLDVCAGLGELGTVTPHASSYHAIEASPVFRQHLQKRNIPTITHDIRGGLPPLKNRPDVITMIISLCHFRGPILDTLLSSLIGEAKKRVIIIEDAPLRPRPKEHPVQRIMNHLTATAYTDDWMLFDRATFIRIMTHHGFTTKEHGARYISAVYEKTPKERT